MQLVNNPGLAPGFFYDFLTPSFVTFLCGNT